MKETMVSYEFRGFAVGLKSFFHIEFQTSVEQARTGVPGIVGRSVRFRRGTDQPSDDTRPHAGQHATRVEQGKQGRERLTAASKTIAGTTEPNPVGEAGSL